MKKGDFVVFELDTFKIDNVKNDLALVKRTRKNINGGDIRVIKVKDFYWNEKFYRWEEI